MKKEKQEQICCPYCNYKFYPKPEEDFEYVNSVQMCFCKKCGEEFPLDVKLDIKSYDYTKYYKKEWE